jgi:hypothetical protein
LAKSHNPSIVSKEWLLEKGIVEGRVSDFAHTLIFSHVETENFKIFLDPDRLQISVKNLTPENMTNLPKIAEKYIDNLPETPYTAVGLNYLFHCTAVTNLKTIFSPDDRKFKKLFSENYKLDGILRFKFNDFNVALTLKHLADEEIAAKFNFHFDGKEIEQFKEKFKSYLEMRKKAEEILRGLFNA